MRRLPFFFILLLPPLPSIGDAAQNNLEVYPAPVRLTAWNPDQQIAVTAHASDGVVHDITADAGILISPTGIVELRDGLLVGLRDGNATLAVTMGDQRAEVQITVEGISNRPAVHFPNDIMPMFSKLGCNGGGCHGKQAGQNGFKLSVFGFDPRADYEAIVHEARGRRVFPAAPRRSLIISKAVGSVPHGGGNRTGEHSRDIELLSRWIEQGMPWGDETGAHLKRLKVFPAERQLQLNAQQQMVVTAIYSNGEHRDVTAAASYTSNAGSVANVDRPGHILIGTVAGEAAITVNYMGQVAASRLIVPQAGLPARDNLLAHSPHKIDHLVATRLDKLRIPPSPVCDDATFLRRLYLTTIGTLPTAEQSSAFVRSLDSRKRVQAIDQVLQREEFADYWALKWSNILMVNPEKMGSLGALRFHQWLKNQLAANRPYDQWVRELVTASGNTGKYGPANFYRAQRTNEEVVRSVSQAFLGIRMDCAQCHHHPFDRWGQDDFYGLAGFFNGLQREQVGDQREFIYHDGYQPTRIPVKDIPVSARVPGGAPLSAESLKKLADPRTAFAEWLTSSQNPFFARLVANRLWKNFLGRGLVEPEDDLRSTNPATNEPLLDYLASRVVDHQFDLRLVMHEILNSTTFQLSSAPIPSNESDAQNFSHYYRRRMPAEVLLDAISQLTLHPEPLAGYPLGTRAIAVWDNHLPSYFLDTFGRSERRSACECGTSGEPTMAQALHLMNAPEIQAKLESPNGRIEQLLDAKKTQAEIVDILTRTAFGREPTQRKLQIAGQLFAGGNARQAAEDYLWTLMNSYDFLFIH